MNKTYFEELHASDQRAEERRSFFCAQRTRTVHLFVQSVVATLLWAWGMR